MLASVSYTNKISEQSKYEQFFNSITNRRNFLRITAILGVSAAIPTILGCNSLGIKGDLSVAVNGFKAYNGFNPNLKYYHQERQTWLDNVIEHKVEWAGIQYDIAGSEPIVAAANGKIAHIEVKKNGYHGLEDKIIMDHGGGIRTHYIHMRSNGSKGLIKLAQTNIVVKRGEVIGFGGKYFKIYMYRKSIIGDMDNYGPHMGFMDYWDGKTNLDFTPDEVSEKNNEQIYLIYDLIKKYVGPGAEQLRDVNAFSKIPNILVHNYGNKNYCWEHAMVFKLLKFMYDSQPKNFNGTKQENDNLISEIYQKQPVILTLPFRQH